jgi:uncharacterized DUF497 family protein
LKNHKVDFAKIEDIFDDPLAIYFADDEHSTFEEIRNGVIGKTAQYGLTVFILLWMRKKQDSLRQDVPRDGW